MINLKVKRSEIAKEIDRELDLRKKLYRFKLGFMKDENELAISRNVLGSYYRKLLSIKEVIEQSSKSTIINPLQFENKKIRFSFDELLIEAKRENTQRIRTYSKQIINTEISRTKAIHYSTCWNELIRLLQYLQSRQNEQKKVQSYNQSRMFT